MRPLTQVVQMTYRNPQANGPLYVPVAVICNTPDDELKRNIQINAARDLTWICSKDPTERAAIMVGGGPSLAESLDEIRLQIQTGGVVYAMNAASKFLTERGVPVDYQVIADAKAETAHLVDLNAKTHLLASQASPLTFEAASRPVVWHLESGNIEACFPQERLDRGGYALTGGGGAVGNAALCVAYALGHRTIHIFGYDSCHRDDQSHAYHQPMNQFIPCVEMTWAGRTFKTSVSMKFQAEKFQLTATALKAAGCALHVHGEGLLQTMYRTDVKDLAEREKYALMWQLDAYRAHSPGELVVPQFLDLVKPDGLIVDFGCGTGRAGLALRAAGHDVYLIDFADNCRDNEALSLPFLEWDLCRPIPLNVKYGLCTDVMEHIPTADVERVISNVMSAAETVFFQIHTAPDLFGQAIGTPLHLTVRPYAWWGHLFEELGYTVVFSNAVECNSQFVVSRRITK